MSDDGSDLLYRYQIDVTPGGHVHDWHAPGTNLTASATADSDFTTRLLDFFDRIDREVDEHADDPIALTNALARIEAILADVRWVRDRIATAASTAMVDQRVRRLTLDEVGVFEVGRSYKRTAWEHERLLHDVIDRTPIRVLDKDTGEVITSGEVAMMLLDSFRPDWKLTGLKNLGLDGNDYCKVERDDDEKPVATPSVRIVVNDIRRQR